MNYEFVWGNTSTSYFNSLYDPGFGEFMTDSGMRYTTGLYSDISFGEKQLADIVSVRYFFSLDEESKDTANARFLGNFGRYGIYENTEFIPPGFTYDLMMSAERFAQIADRDEKHAAYMKYLVADDPEQFSDVLTLCDDTYSAVGDDEYKALVERSRSECAYDTAYSPSGVTARIDLARENIVFWSVSYNPSWKAYVDGAEVPVYKVNNGLIGVRVPAGDHSVELVYKTPLAGAGIAVSCTGAAVYLI